MLFRSIGEADYDAAVVDIKMPGMDGLELLDNIKKVDPDLPVMLVTGHGDHELAVQALRRGAHDYVTKPIDRDYFVTSLGQAIKCRALDREVVTKRSELEQRALELEDCVRERTIELRELLHREQAARAELHAAKAQLEEADRERRKFISLVAHEIGTPLTTVRGYAEMLARPTTRPETQERARTFILSETRRVSRLVSDLAAAAGVSVGQFEIQRSPCDLAAIAREQVELSRSLGRRHEIRLEAPSELPMVCDGDRVAQVLTNLLENAIKYSPGGEIAVQVWRESERAMLRVSDNGPGVPPESAEAVFELGRRLKNGHNGAEPRGTGFGLYIAKAIVEAHGGRIWVENRPEGGASFTASLPLEPPGADLPAGDASPR